ncbi:MAG TPA: hypothetical protein ENJ84_06675 [Gammaproteobacteria bacterium]|nr:hypothetical protein [Gammaproteobacteria bacterium]
MALDSGRILFQGCDAAQRVVHTSNEDFGHNSLRAAPVQGKAGKFAGRILVACLLVSSGHQQGKVAPVRMGGKIFRLNGGQILPLPEQPRDLGLGQGTIVVIAQGLHKFLLFYTQGMRAAVDRFGPFF